MPHYEIVSPLQEPLTWVLFVITWFSCIICVCISVHFHRAGRGAWWLLIALALALPLLEEVGIALWIGLPPLPYRLAYPPQQIIDGPTAHATFDPRQPGPTTSTESTIEYTVSRVQWSFYPPLMAAALIWAYRVDKRKGITPTAQG